VNTGQVLIVGRKRTLIIVGRTLTEPKATFAGVTLEISFARSKVWMATFNEERVPLRFLGLGIHDLKQTRLQEDDGRWRLRTRAQTQMETGRRLDAAMRPGQTQPLEEEDCIGG